MKRRGTKKTREYWNGKVAGIRLVYDAVSDVISRRGLSRDKIAHEILEKINDAGYRTMEEGGL